MDLNELRFPLRVYWDLSSEPARLDCRIISHELLEIKALHLNLTDAGTPVSRACTEVLGELKDSGIAITLTVSAEECRRMGSSFLTDFKVKALLIRASALDDVARAVELIGSMGGDGIAGISYALDNASVRDFPKAVALAREEGIKLMVFPMERLGRGADVFFLNKNEREKIGMSLETAAYDPQRMVIHDPFLWRVFHPKEEFPACGCQAANSMVYISPEGTVMPCPSLPAALGNLEQRSLKEILLSEEKRKLRVALRAEPDGCISCESRERCVGGCRGRTYALWGDFDHPDPACH
jgi:GeoRSP system SPASM domain protein